ncbi:MAG: DUF2953 domain-containing protein [Treponema sp.]|nr:DUF2953 domain-containing protein [Treponema sp.]
MVNEIKISTEEEFLSFLKNIDNEEFLTNSILKADKLSVSMKIEGEKFSASLTGSLIKALADYQQRVYHIYKVQKYGISSNKQLTEEELRALEIKVEIKPGCTEAVIGFVKDIIPEVVSKMTGQELSKTIIAVTGIVAGAWALKGIVAPAISNAFKTKRKEIEAKIELAKTEKEKEYLTSIQSITHDAIEGMRSVATGLAVTAPEKIAIDDKCLTVSEAENLAAEMKKPRKETKPDSLPDIYSVEGEFKVLNINYEKAVTLMKAEHIESKVVYDNISLMDGWLTEESFNVLKDAQERDPVWFRIILTRDGKSKRFSPVIDVNSIGKKTN